MKFYVNYFDGYYDNGDVGIEEFNTAADACKFIQDRIKDDPNRTIDMYKIIEGKELKIKAVDVVSRIIAT